MGGIRGHSRALRVLLVDDSDADRVRFGRALSGAGYEVYAAEDASQAWARLQEQSFDVLVSDRQMPGTDGLELTRLVRASREHARIPVIMVSGMDAPSDRARPGSRRVRPSTSARPTRARHPCCSTPSNA